MPRKLHDEEEVLKHLRRKKDCKIVGNHIMVLNGKGKKQQKSNDLGNGSWGKIDFLVGKKGYIQTFTPEF
jgi:hypothetical protein